MADDTARLVAVVEANLKGFTKGMEQAQRIADQRFGAIEKRMRQSEGRFSNAFGNLGSKLLGGAALVGIERFVSHIVDTASKIKDTADALGVSTDALQEWGVMAGRAGVGQEEFNKALDKFGKSLGEAQLKGGEMGKLFRSLGVDVHAGPEEAFLQFADAVAATGSQSQKVALVTTALGRSAAGLVPLLQQGRDAIKQQGDELKRTGAIMSSEAIDKIDTLGDKWGDLKRQLTATGGNVLAGFADEFSQFADVISSPEFQSSMRAFGAALAEIAVLFAKLHEFMPEIVGGLTGLVLGGPMGGLIGVGVGAAAAIATGFRTPTFPDRIDVTPRVGGKRGGIDRSGALGQDNAKLIAQTAAEAAKAAQELVKAIDEANVELFRGTLGAFKAVRKQIDDNAAAEIAAIEAERAAKQAALQDQVNEGKLVQADYLKAIANLNQEAADKESAIIVAQRNERLKNAREEVEARYQLNREVVDQRRETIRSEHDAILELARGTQDYYKVARELSDEDAALEEQRIREELNHQLENFARQKAEVEKAGGQWADYEDERFAATEKAELAIQAVRNEAEANRIRLQEEETRRLEYQIQVMDQVRGGLEDVAVAGTHGFKSLADAGRQFIEQLAEMTLRLYIIRPLLEATFGRAGTGTGGGLFGSFIGGLFGGGADPFPETIAVTPGLFPGRASGGRVSAGTPYIVGENRRPELFVPDSSGTVVPNIPSLAGIGTQSPAVINIDARGAQMGVADQINAALTQWAPRIVGASVGQVRRNLAPMMAETSKRYF